MEEAPPLPAFCHTVGMQRGGVPAFQLKISCGNLRAAASVLLLAAAPALRAQTAAPAPAEPAAPQTLYTLHVYANLVQNPTLVLSDDFQPVPRIRLDQFAISLDSGPAFHPTRMHMEGDDPITLGILIDDSHDSFNLLPGLGNALASLVPQYLHPRDHVSIFALDCALVNSGANIPAGAAALKQGVLDALADPVLHAGKPKPACSGSLRLWDAVAQVSAALAELPGWRVLLIISRGIDGRSVSEWDDVTRRTAQNGISVFGLDYRLPIELSSGFGDPFSFRRDGRHSYRNASENLFDLLCRSNGGLVLYGVTNQLRQSLQEFMTLLRSRYILEYPRPDTTVPGLHSIAISVPRRDFFISVGGLTIDIPNPRIKSDPTTVPSAPSPAVMGRRRPDQPKR